MGDTKSLQYTEFTVETTVRADQSLMAGFARQALCFVQWAHADQEVESALAKNCFHIIACGNESTSRNKKWIIAPGFDT